MSVAWERRIKETCDRYEERKTPRSRRVEILQNLKEGKGGDWRELDEPGRVMRRLSDLGLYEVAGQVASQAGGAGAPEFAEEGVAGADEVPLGVPEIDVLERIIGANDLQGVDFLFRGGRVSRSVGRVVLRTSLGAVRGFGTGFMISPRLMMTNNHVIASAAEGAGTLLQFDFFERRGGRMQELVEFELEPGVFFLTDRDLDYAVVAVAPQRADGRRVEQRGWCPLIAASGKAVVGETLNIVQHPGGQPQQAALRDNRIVDVFDDFLHYTSDTQKGSSGAPVFNDQWDLAALHHSGVPKRDAEERILLRSGEPWDGSPETAPMIAWVANEGVRISRIVTDLRSRAEALTSVPRALLEKALAGQAPPEVEESRAVAPAAGDLPTGPRLGPDGRVHWRVPIDIRIGVGSLGAGGSGSGLGAAPATGPATLTIGPPDGGIRPDPETLRAALDRLRECLDLTYYDPDQDAGDRDTYYQEITDDLKGKTLFRGLHELVSGSHTRELSYKSARLDFLYPLVDLRQAPRNLRSLYSGKGFDPAEVIRNELEIEALKEARRIEFFRTEAAADEEALEAFLDALEAELPFNCEHVVPQSWFNKKSPMKADLHHLFTCEMRCNSFRSNIPYFDFGLEEEAMMDECGRREEGKFEPLAGKGAAARATLYFLLRYPGQIGDRPVELSPDRLKVLRGWHETFEPDSWELHRNAEIAVVQGNRNPLIDHPEWVERIDFRHGFAGI